MGGPIKVMFTPDTAGTKHLRFVVGYFDPDQGLDMHIHPESEEVYYIIEGQGMVYVGKEKATTRVDRNTAVYIPPGTIHGIRNTSGGKLIVAFMIAPGREPSQKASI
ncbi:cupin domain-containing protein [Candidatus Bathyarchaeota archaeon]|jgi:oxalate decarboxylase/phosphoglucose isomerase-like protein (cupin superfamily)|nr:cupin domain-containing protein [Candidatus Bathyarchaeota archaeon]